MIESIAWPAVVVLLGLVFMGVFRAPLSGLLNRTRSVGKSGLETFDAQQLSAPSAKPDPLQEFLSAFDNQLLVEQEAGIVKDLTTRGLFESAAQKALIRALAGTQIALHFERVSQLIWAGQVSALTYLNSRPAPVEEEHLRPFYADAAKRYPEVYQGYSFDNWLRFLDSWWLIKREKGMVALEKAGREFLKWRIDVGRAGPFHG
jgi:hypothetical protein